MKYILVLLSILALASMKTFGTPEDGLPYRDDTLSTPHLTPKMRKMAKQFNDDIKSGKLKEKTNVALDGLVRFAIFKLRLEGHKSQADQIQKEWESGWNTYLLRTGRALGDHRPLSVWLASRYMMIELILGKDVCHALRLDDIKTINYALPVVFSCVDNVDEAEYALHFVPLAGVTIYWGSFFACVGFTWGSGFLFCAPISMGCEYLTDKVIAPNLNGPVWRLSCHQ